MILIPESFLSDFAWLEAIDRGFPCDLIEVAAEGSTLQKAHRWFLFTGESLHDELELTVEQVGLTPVKTLRRATGTPPSFSGMQGELGTIEGARRAIGAFGINCQHAWAACPLDDLHDRADGACTSRNSNYTQGEIREHEPHTYSRPPSRGRSG